MKTGMKLALSALACISSFSTHAEQLLSGVKSAENSVLASNKHLYVTSEGAVYDVIKDSWGWRTQAVPAYYRDGQPASCVFLGITEMQGRVYTVCTDSAINLFAKKHLFGMDLAAATPTLREVAEITNVALPNGLTDDDNGTLYLADHAAPLLPGKIVKLKLSSSTTLASQTTVKSYLACKPNGLKYNAGKLYVSLDAFSEVGLAQIYRYDVSSTGSFSNDTVVYNSFGFLDDFALVKDGLVITEFLFGLVSHISESTGKVLHQTSFISPTSVTVGNSAPLATGDVLVTERLTGAVQRYSNTWGVQAR